eukprot:1376931-Pleurochrysis_carterae.AAC.2
MMGSMLAKQHAMQTRMPCMVVAGVAARVKGLRGFENGAMRPLEAIGGWGTGWCHRLRHVCSALHLAMPGRNLFEAACHLIAHGRPFVEL